MPVWQFGRGWWQVASPCHPCLAVAALSWTVPGRVCAAAFKLCVPAGWSTKSTCGSTPAPQHKAQHSRGSPLAAMRQLGLLQCVVRLYISALAAAAAVAPRASCGCWCFSSLCCAVLCWWVDHTYARSRGVVVFDFETPAAGRRACVLRRARNCTPTLVTGSHSAGDPGGDSDVMRAECCPVARRARTLCVLRPPHAPAVQTTTCVCAHSPVARCCCRMPVGHG